MLKLFNILFFCCVGFSVAQTFTEDYFIDEFTGHTAWPDYWFTPTDIEFPDCGPNEVYECAFPCPPQQTCRDRNESIACLEEVQSCELKCVCQFGFFRNTEDGVCISEKQCAKCPGAHEHYACGDPCDNVCNTLYLQNRTSCPYTYADCNHSCYCDDGYARDEGGVCIPISECPLPKCGQNEEYTDCKPACSNETCSSIVSPPNCDSEEPCSAGCKCKDGFFRIEENAPCIPRCACPEMNDSNDCSSLKSKSKLSYYLYKLFSL